MGYGNEVHPNYGEHHNLNRNRLFSIPALI